MGLTRSLLPRSASERVAVIGGNGSGKSTLIRVLSRTLPASEGTIEGAGSVVPFAALAGPISTERTGCDNLRMIARLLGLPLGRLEERLPEVLDFSELGALAREKVCRYSSKSFLRLSLAMALCMDADIYLIDDGLSAPGCNLSREGQGEVRRNPGPQPNPYFRLQQFT